jgi:hypothetical protein
VPLSECIFVQRRKHRALPRFVQVSKSHTGNDWVRSMFFGESLFIGFSVLYNIIPVCAASQLDEEEPIDPTAWPSDHQVRVMFVHDVVQSSVQHLLEWVGNAEDAFVCTVCV